ncbi:MAG: hypothetical protein ACRDCH_02365 [Metamycoplasmataceae bacterium]
MNLYGSEISLYGSEKNNIYESEWIYMDQKLIYMNLYGSENNLYGLELICMDQKLIYMNQNESIWIRN